MTAARFRAQYLAATQGGEPTDYVEKIGLESLAAKLLGEIDGGFIRCPSPGRPPSDRSCLVRIDPERPGLWFVYDCRSSKSAADAMVRAALGLASPRRSHPDAVERIWRETQPAEGTIVEDYLRSRAITLPPPSTLRYHTALRHPAGGRWPAMVAERLDASGVRVGVHRTFLRPDGAGKAPVEPQRLDLGPTGGTAIRFSPVAEEIAVAEGIETTLSVMQASARPGWAAGSAGALRRLVLPQEVRSVLICADGDEAGEAAARAAAARWMGEGRRIRVAHAPAGRDFNDLLMEVAR